jgi:low temperature requirement protein LtrA
MKQISDFLSRPQLLEKDTGRRASWSELFFDLIFVAAVAQVGEPLQHDYSPHGLVRYTFLFCLIWWAWNGHTAFHSRFEANDWPSSVLSVIQTFLAAVMAANATEGLASESAAGFGAAYAGMRLTLVIQYLRVRNVRVARALAYRSAIGYTIAALVWIASAFVEPPLRYCGWGVGIAFEALTYWAAHRKSSAVPPDTHHFPERCGLFTIILFGEFIAAVMRGIQSQNAWSPAAASAAIAGLCFGFLLRSWYFDGAGGAREREIETVEQHTRFHVWNYAHLPLFIGIGVAGIGFQKLVNTDSSVRLTVQETLLLLSSVSLLTLALAVVQLTGEEGNASKRWGAAQIVSALLLPSFSGIMAGFPLVVSAILMVAYCAAQVVIAQKIFGPVARDDAAAGCRHGSSILLCDYKRATAATWPVLDS